MDDGLRTVRKREGRKPVDSSTLIQLEEQPLLSNSDDEESNDDLLTVPSMLPPDDDSDDDLLTVPSVLPPGDNSDDELLTVSGEYEEEESFTVEEAVESVGLGWFQLHLFLVTGFFKAADASEVLLLAVVSPLLRCEWLLPESQVALISTVVFVGMFFGSILWGKSADLYGRKPVVLISAFWISFMGLLTAFSPNYVWILILRALVGFGFGGSVQSLTLLAEYLPSRRRAKVLILGHVMWAIGTCFQMWLAYMVVPTLGWRWLVALSSLPIFISLPGLVTIPESARFLVAAGQIEKAMAVLHRAARRNGKELPRGKLVESKQVKRGQLRDIVCSSYTRTTLQLWLMWFVVTFSYYGMLLLSSEPRLLNYPQTCGDIKVEEVIEAEERCHCEVMTKDDYMARIISNLGEFGGIPLNVLMIDYLGRRVALVVNFLFLALFFFLMQVCSTMTWLTVFMFGVRAFAPSVFMAMYIYISEFYPTTLRSLATGSSSAVGRVGAMVTPFVAQVLDKWSVPLTVSVYGVINVLCAVNAALLPLETKGRALPQTQGDL